MNDVRFQKIELQVSKHEQKLKVHDRRHEEHDQHDQEHDRRFTDHTTKLGGYDMQLKAQAALLENIQRTTDGIERLGNTTEDILSALAALGKVAKWILTISALCAAIVTAWSAFIHKGA